VAFIPSTIGLRLLFRNPKHALSAIKLFRRRLIDLWF
jgi:hypothetical protein